MANISREPTTRISLPMRISERNEHTFSVASGLEPILSCDEPSSVLDKIENLAFEFLNDLVFGDASGSIAMVSRTSRNAQEHEENGALMLGTMTQFRRLNPRGATAMARQLQVLSAVQKLLLSGNRISQRELFYLLIESFDNQQQLNDIVLDVSATLGVPRHALNIGAASRGVLAGCLRIALCGSLYYVDCEYVGTNGWPIPGDVLSALSVVVSSSARYLLIIEKFGVFSRLVQDRFYEQMPCILLCGKGYPSVATRAMASLLAQRLRIPVLGIADFNPHGLALLQCYRQGSVRSSIESFNFGASIKFLTVHCIGQVLLSVHGASMSDNMASSFPIVCDVKWMALRSSHIRQYAHIATDGQPLTDRDEKLLDGLQKRNKKVRTDARYLQEVEAMKTLGKYELQWLYGHHEGTSFLGRFLLKSILHADYF